VKPTISQFLQSGAQTMLTQIAPHLGATPTLASHVSTLAMIALFAAQEADRAADTLLRENAAMRALFADAAGRALPKPLREDLARAAQGSDASARLAALEAGNAALKQTLITLHTAVEAIDAPWAREVDRAIWSLLREGARARALSLPGG
jgi:hypothetical protein